MSPARMSKFENAIRLVLAYNETFNHHDVDGMTRLMSGNCLFESPSPSPHGTPVSGLETIKTYWQTYFEKFKGVNNTIEDVFSTAFHCIMRWKRTWVTQAGEEKEMRGVDIFKVKDNLISEYQSYLKGDE